MNNDEEARRAEEERRKAEEKARQDAETKETLRKQYEKDQEAFRNKWGV